MIVFSPEVAQALSTGAISSEWLLWVTARNRTNGATETTGFWTGDDVQNFTLEGESRTYYGAGPLANVGRITYRSGTEVQMQKVSLSILDKAVEQAIREYDPRLAPVQLHLALFSTETGQLSGTHKMFEGWIDEAKIKEGPKGGQAKAICELSLASSARAGTKGLTSMKSDASQRGRDPSDAGRQYASISGQVQVVWGEESDNPHRVADSN